MPCKMLLDIGKFGLECLDVFLVRRDLFLRRIHILFVFGDVAKGLSASPL